MRTVLGCWLGVPLHYNVVTIMRWPGAGARWFREFHEVMSWVPEPDYWSYIDPPDEAQEFHEDYG